MRKIYFKKIRVISIVLTLIFANCLIFSTTIEFNSNKNINQSQNNWENIPLTGPNGEPIYNYATALARTILYYEASKCGDNLENNRLNWRGDCHLNDSITVILSDGSTVTIDMTGGYHDAGDHIKFGICEAYAASTLGWGFYEYREQYEETGQDIYLLETVKSLTDYFIKAHPEPNLFIYSVGSGADHTYWGPPELQDDEICPRDIRIATPENPASDVCGNTAAALALMYLNYQHIDMNYAELCLEHAIQLYELGSNYHGLSDGLGFYPSATYYDDLSWGAVWLYIATGDTTYLDDIESYIAPGAGGLDDDMTIENGINWVNYWTHCWDTVWGGVFIVLAETIEHPTYITQAEANLDYWMSSNMPESPGGVKVVNSWGTLRYSSAEALMALVYYKYSGNIVYRDFAASQMNYILGSNPLERCYIVGLYENSAKHPHHRAAHGSETLSMNDPLEHKHVLHGALVGGPDQTDAHNDETSDYVSNEVTIDYNAACVGAFAAMRREFGPEQLSDPDPDPEPEIEAYYSEAKLETDNEQRTQITTRIHNHAIHPPHFEDKLSYRYFIDLTELFDLGYDESNVNVEVYYNADNAAVISDLNVYNEDNHIYYVETSWNGYPFYGYMEFQFGLVFTSSDWVEVWDSSNDFSFIGIKDTLAQNYNMPVYLDGVLIWGNEPIPGSDPIPLISEPADIFYIEGDTGNIIIWIPTDNNPTSYSIYQDDVEIETGSWISNNLISINVDGLIEGTYTYNIILFDEIGQTISDIVNVEVFRQGEWDLGDVNHDGEVNIVDALLIAQYYVGRNLEPFYSEQADTNEDSKIDIIDALLIAQFYVGIISSLPPE
ncbi:MAG: glycoside hydrolase family 9 protein [Candidatus Lokiarchaeota archaeon]|nr:glycoside hydrolase family 9 protein [Candidatus Lokiarchaeota archaeon]